MDDSLLLSVRGLKTYFAQDEGTVHAVDGVSFDMAQGATLGIVGESGCGKSVTARSILRIVDRPGRVIEGSIHFRRSSRNGSGAQVVDLATLDPNGAEMRAIRGAEIALIFQEPMSSFSHYYTVGNQIMEGILEHSDATPEDKQGVDYHHHERVSVFQRRSVRRHAAGCSDSTLMRLRTSSERLLSCVEPASIVCGQRFARSRLAP